MKLSHQTDLTYSELISESVMELRMAPRQEQDQHRLSFTLAIGPPTSAFSYFDWLGNTVHAFTVNPFHKQIRIVATSVVETDRRRVEPERFADTWPIPGDFTTIPSTTICSLAGRSWMCRSCASCCEIVQPQPGDVAGRAGAAHASPDQREVHIQEGRHHRRQPDHRYARRRARASARISRT